MPEKPWAAPIPSTLTADARNRAWRTFVQGLAIDVGVAVAVALYAIASDPTPIVWTVVGASLARTIVQSGAAFVMRRFLDGSSVPTPLPPANPGPPAENHPLNGRV